LLSVKKTTNLIRRLLVERADEESIVEEGDGNRGVESQVVGGDQAAHFPGGLHSVNTSELDTLPALLV
jgi:hypothetical protein